MGQNKGWVIALIVVLVIGLLCCCVAVVIALAAGWFSSDSLDLFSLLPFLNLV